MWSERRSDAESRPDDETAPPPPPPPPPAAEEMAEEEAEPRIAFLYKICGIWPPLSLVPLVGHCACLNLNLTSPHSPSTSVLPDCPEKDCSLVFTLASAVYHVSGSIKTGSSKRHS